MRPAGIFPILELLKTRSGAGIDGPSARRTLEPHQFPVDLPRQEDLYGEKGEMRGMYIGKMVREKVLRKAVRILVPF